MANKKNITKEIPPEKTQILNPLGKILLYAASAVHFIPEDPL